MNPEPNQHQLDALEKYLRGELNADHPDLPVEEAILARQLRATLARLQPAPQFVAELNVQLTRPQPRASAQRPGLRYFLSSLAGVAALMLLAFLLRWLILSVAPQPPVPALPFTETPSNPDATATPLAPIPTDVAQTYAPLFYESYSLGADFPSGPEQANLYEQVFSETATLETARALAAKFGLNGGLYLSPEIGPNGEAVYLATDGKQRLYIYSPIHYNYYPDWITMQQTREKTSDAQFAISQAEAFLQARNLLDFPYRLETAPENPSVVSFVLTVDDLPTRFAFMHQAPRLEAQISADGEVMYLSENLPAYRLTGRYPLRTAENAWEKLIGVSTDLGLVGDFSSSSPTEYGPTWLRHYPLNQPLRLSGSLEKVSSAEGGDVLLTLDSHPLSGNLSGLEALQDTIFIEAQGQFVLAGGVQKFQVESWQKTIRIEFLNGSLERSGEQVFLLSADGRRLELPDLPTGAFDAAHGKEFHATGVAEDNRFDWSSIHVGPLGGGGGGGGGVTSLAKLNLSGTPAPTATPQVLPTPLVAEAVTGQRLEGVSGGLNILIFVSEDGQRRMQVILNLDQPINTLESYSLAEGPALAGIEKYNLQPVRVWGTVDGLDPYNVPEVTVERYEPLYPGLEIQNWLGKERIVSLDGKAVLVFTTQEGQAYVVRESLAPDFDPANQPATPDQIFVMGLLPPGETWGGYPVLDLRRETYLGPDNTMTLEEIKKQIPGAEPKVIPETTQPPILKGARIEKIELVYLVKDMSGMPAPVDPVYLQPAWSFSGHYANGTPFEIYVQALTDTYLLPEPDQ